MIKPVAQQQHQKVIASSKHIKVQPRHHKTVSQQKLLELVSKSLKMDKNNANERDESVGKLSEYDSTAIY